ncbi:MAG TPA: hypothetical protein PKA05_15095, partial [Roseiflexaceae bacterium]|nr:hypothetical protein [Roseiflexaceae bacterium]
MQWRILAIILAVMGMALAGAWLRPPAVSLAVDDAAAGRHLAGFHALERSDNVPFRWSSGRAALFLHGFDGRMAQVALRIASPRPDGDASLTLKVAERSFGPFAVASHWRRYHILVPTRPVDDTALRFDIAWFTTAADSRRLGVALHEFSAYAVGIDWMPSFERLFFLGSLPLIGALLVCRLGGRQRWQVFAALVIGVPAGSALFFTTLAGYYLPTAGWPWWPLLPLGMLVGWPYMIAWWHAAVGWLGQYPWPAGAGGVLLLVLGLGMLRGAELVPGGFVLLVAGVILLIMVMPVTWDVRRVAISRSEIAILGALLLVGLGLRLYRLDALPLGLWRDEARHGLLAVQIWQQIDFRPAYVVVGADLPALLFYVMAP